MQETEINGFVIDEFNVHKLEEGKKQGIYLRTLGNIVMLVPPLAIKEKELEMLLSRTIKTIQAAKSKII